MKEKQRWIFTHISLAVMVLLIIGSVMFVRTMRSSLWDTLALNALEVTKQGAEAFSSKLDSEVVAVNNLAYYLSGINSDELEAIEDAGRIYSKEENIELVLADLEHGRAYVTAKDDYVVLEEAQLAEYSEYGECGWLDPFYSVFDGLQYIGYYERFRFADGESGLVKKNIRMDTLGERYMLSFYNDQGYSYVIDNDGNIIVRAQAKYSNRTLSNIFDVISADGNEDATLKLFRQSIVDQKNGVMKFNFDGESYVFAFAATGGADNWSFLALIPESALSTHLDNIMQTSTLLTSFVVVGIFMVLILFYNNKLTKEEGEKVKYIAQLNEKNKELEILSDETFEAIAKAIDVNDRYTAGHSRRVAKYSRMIAEGLGYQEEALEEVYCAGLIHDVGKLGIDNQIINKNGRLSQEEYAEIKKHPSMGYEILENITIEGDFAYGAKFHHERVDGTGYPDGLSGDEIPEIARIISIADAYDAMTSKRAYRGALPQEKVREQIVEGSGSQFDEKIASVMLGLIDQDTEYKMKQG